MLNNYTAGNLRVATFQKRGYTLMELITVICIIAVFLNVGDSTTSGFFSAQRVAGNAAIFIQDIRAARFSAVNDQTYHRMYIFKDYEGCIASYVVQAYASPTIPANDIVNSRTYTADNASWINLLDTPYREFEDDIYVRFATGPSYIFFRPDGLLVSSPEVDSLPIPESQAYFSDGVTSMTVLINAAGVIESEEWYEE
ncbi:MAG: prepilin-type N-terminal cleavage/methylation domain-containing protein [Candidatus Riflebacteria bacterium]|nr:prepilin-type N-terminal cleavage/methylation domain-containing protein [Candidatus Riflebacteria bacterium]